MQFQEILVVDDSEVSRMIITKCFKISGFSDAVYYYAENGEKALKVLSENKKIDLIVTDLNMPGMNGLDFLKKLKEENLLENKSVVITSAPIDFVTEKYLENFKILGIIKKPLSPEKVINLLKAEK